MAMYGVTVQLTESKYLIDFIIEILVPGAGVEPARPFPVEGF